jgi:UDP-2,3-diacylglucosamine pyrophosphatase LpxH
LLDYLKSIRPDILILNGDIIDFWNLKSNSFPKEHLQVVNRLLKMLSQGTRIYYLTGNHDDVLRRFSDFSNGNFSLRDQLILQLNGKRFWFFHGDAFDISILHARWLAKLGGISYEWLVRFNRSFNILLGYLGKSPTSFSKTVKMKIKEVVKFVADFEQKAIDLAQKQGYDAVICGHIHKPNIENKNGILYMNSGDWVEHLTALEYQFGEWQIYTYNPLDYEFVNPKIKVSQPNDEESKLEQPSAAKFAEVFLAQKPKHIVLGSQENFSGTLWDGIE